MLERVLRYPGRILIGGLLFCLLMLLISNVSSQWHWFPRGGAVLGLAGFLVSGREILLYRRPTPDRVENRSRVSGASAVVRENRFGQPVFDPSLPKIDFSRPLGMTSRDDEITVEEAEREQAERQDAWDEADPIEETEVVIPGNEGYTPKDPTELSHDDLRMLRYAAIAGTVGTLIWAFGDLLG